MGNGFLIHVLGGSSGGWLDEALTFGLLGALGTAVAFVYFKLASGKGPTHRRRGRRR